MNDEVHVYTGLLYLAETDVDGKRYVRYQVIGKNDVAISTQFFKMIRIGKGRFPYIILNKRTGLSDFQDFEVPIDILDKVSRLKIPLKGLLGVVA